MFESYIENIRGIIFHPQETFERFKTSTLSKAYQHYVLLLICNSVLMGIISLISALISFTAYQAQLEMVPVIGPVLMNELALFKPFFLNWSLLLIYLWFILLMILIFLKGFFLHLFVLLLGGEQGVSKTLIAILYAATPLMLLGWIPYIGIIGLIWSVALCIVGIKVFQEFSWGKAGATILIPTLLLITGFGIILFMALFFIDAMNEISMLKFPGI